MAERDPADKTRKFAQKVVELQNENRIRVLPHKQQEGAQGQYYSESGTGRFGADLQVPSVEKVQPTVRRQPEGTDGDYLGSAHPDRVVDRPQPMTSEQAAYIKNMEQEQEDNRVRNIVTKPFHFADDWAKRKGQEMSGGLSDATKEKVRAIAHRYAQWADPKGSRDAEAASQPRDAGEMRVGSDYSGAIPLLEPHGTELHEDGLRRAGVQEPVRSVPTASLSGTSSVRQRPPSGMQAPEATAAPLQTHTRPMTLDELEAYAKSLQASQQVQNQAQLDAGPSLHGAIDHGTINPYGREIVDNHDGTSSTVRSMSYGSDGKETLVPTAYEGSVHSDEDSIRHAEATGENLGTYRRPEDATRAAMALHDDYAAGKYDAPGQSKIRKSLEGRNKRTPYDASDTVGGDIESLGPSGQGNQDYPDYNFIKSGSPNDVAEAFASDKNAISPKTEAYMRSNGLWTQNTDDLLARRGLR